MINEEYKARETSVPSANKYSVFGLEVDKKMIRIAAIVAAICYILPTSDVWNKLPKSLTSHSHSITGFILRTLNTIMESILAIPMLWVSVLLAAAATMLLLAALAEKVSASDNKNRIALYVLCAVQVLLAVSALATSLTGDGSSIGSDGDMELFASVFALLLMVPALMGLVVLEIYIGIRFNKYDEKRFKNLGVCFITYPIVGFILLLFSLTFDDYSVGAKIMDFSEAAIDCIWIYFIYAALTSFQTKNALFKSVISYGLVIYGFMVMIFAIDASFDPSIVNPVDEGKGVNTKNNDTTDADIDDFLDDLFDD